MAMTVATPMTMPRIVRNERSLWPKTAMNAKRRFSTGLLIAQRLHRRQPGRLDRRKDAGDESREHGNGKAADDQRRPDERRQRGHRREDFADDVAEEDSHCAADERQQRRLGQELPEDVAAPRSDRPPDADLPRPLDHR